MFANKNIIAVAFLATTSLLSTSCDKLQSLKLQSDEEKFSYSIGQQIGTSLKAEGIEVKTDVIAMAIQDVLAGKESRLKPEEMQQAMMAMRTKIMEKAKSKGEENKKKGDEYLAKNKSNSNVKVTASGLQYEVVTEGTGAMPTEKDQVKVHYKGTLIDGTEFDSSYKRNEPATFPVMGVIPGWTEALKLMKAGSKWKVTVPSELAYGAEGRPGIPPSSVLVFEVELLDVIKGAAGAMPGAPKAKKK